MLLKKRLVVLFSVLFLGTLLYIRCNSFVQNEYVITPIATHYSGQSFVGSVACMECHAQIYNTHIKTAHYNTSSIASDLTIKGNTSLNENELDVNDSIYLKIEQNNGLFYQKAYLKDSDSLITSHKIDLVIGSGVKGQSFLNWRADSLFQIHTSYFTKSNSWIKSPGFRDSILQNNRRTSARCLECHTTYVETRVSDSQKNRNAYNKNRFINGIDCERCHGPAGEHVKFHKEHPKKLEAKHIKTTKSLTRQQQLDACALCHSGPRKLKMKPEFSYTIGEDLNKFSSPDFFSTRRELDVHGNQYGMLMASKCFKESETMTCATCHDPHKNERSNTSKFINKCISCHDKSSDCSLDMTTRTNSTQNCITCHMPKIKSKSMFKTTAIAKDTISVSVYSHHIRVYQNSID